MPLVVICCRGCHCEPPMYDTAHVRFDQCHLCLLMVVTTYQEISPFKHFSLYITQCSSTCREGNCRALLCAHDLEEEVVVTVKVQLYEIVVSRWLGAWSMALMLWLPCY